MKAVAVTRPDDVAMVEVAKPTPGPYQALVRTEVALLCNATDSKIIAGHFPGVNGYPLVLGHESAGIVEAVGEKVRNFKVGDRAIGGLVLDFQDPHMHSAWGGFCEYTLCNDHGAMVNDRVADEEHGWRECFEIQQAVPPDITPEAAGLLCMWREVLGAFSDFHFSKGEELLVFGAGPVGLSFVKLGRLLGMKYIAAVDPLPHKRLKAAALGAHETFSPNDDFTALVRRRGRPFDAVVDAVGLPAITNTALPLIKMSGTIAIYGVIADDVIPISKSRGPYNFNLIVHQWPTRHRERAALGPLCSWIRQDALKPEDFISHEFPIDRIHDALAAIKRGEVIKALLRY